MGIVHLQKSPMGFCNTLGNCQSKTGTVSRSGAKGVEYAFEIFLSDLGSVVPNHQGNLLNVPLVAHTCLDAQQAFFVHGLHSVAADVEGNLSDLVPVNTDAYVTDIRMQRLDLDPDASSEMSLRYNQLRYSSIDIFEAVLHKVGICWPSKRKKSLRDMFKPVDFFSVKRPHSGLFCVLGDDIIDDFCCAFQCVQGIFYLMCDSGDKFAERGEASGANELIGHLLVFGKSVFRLASATSLSIGKHTGDHTNDVVQNNL